MARLAKLFGEAGVSRYFIWLTPGPNMEAVRDWLLGAGLGRFPFVSYPTLAPGVDEPSLVDTGLEVRELAVEEAAHLAGPPAEAAWPEYLRTTGLPGFCHFMAFDGNRPVASAVLCTFEELGYLCMARTAEADRGRGAQRALIAKRIDKARVGGAEPSFRKHSPSCRFPWAICGRRGSRRLTKRRSTRPSWRVECLRTRRRSDIPWIQPLNSPGLCPCKRNAGDCFFGAARVSS